MENKGRVTLSNKKGIHALITACKDFGVEDVIICPGSRNAPLTISFNRSEYFKCHSIADERVAGFYALGMSLASGKPTVVVCTSGSAAINLSPAIAEAYYQRSPLIVVTADRPLAWTDQGNGQTIRQEGVFKNFIKSEFSLYSEPASRDEIWMNRRKLSECFNTALVKDKGPVHINVPLSEPLYGTSQYSSFSNPVFYQSQDFHSVPNKEQLEEFIYKINNSRKVMILVGQLAPDENLSNLLSDLSQKNNITILTETTSNLQVESAIDSIDRVIMSIKSEQFLESLMPDVLISIGGYVVSKKIKGLLREFQPSEHWHIDKYEQSLDTYQSLTKEVMMSPTQFFEGLNAHIEQSTSTYSSVWQKTKTACQGAHRSFVEHIDYSDFYAFREILNQINTDTILHMANSTPVRYVQLFGSENHISYYGNRGTSGIDGCTSTAAGFAKKDYSKNHILITGDTAFIYDSNALWNRDFPSNLKVIIINNSGGGIFRIIEGPNQIPELEDFFETNHPVDLKKLVEAYGLKIYKAENPYELGDRFEDFLFFKGAAIFEIVTDSEKNPEVLRAYFRHIQKEIEPQLAVLSIK